MIVILSLFQDFIESCYLHDTLIVHDVNTNLIEITLFRNQTEDLYCQEIDKGVRVNLTINTPLGNKVPLITTTVQNFSYLETNQITIQNALDPVVEFDVIYYAQIDIYTYGKVLSIKTTNFYKQQSNLEACYYDTSVGNIFRDRVEITLTPTGICALQMQTKAPGLINYLEKISFQTIGLNLQYDLTGFDYGQAKQTLIFYGNLIDTSLKNPFLGGRVVFNSNQGGTVISFTHDILDMRLSTVPGFITGGEVGMWNSKFYIKISFNELLYQRYLDVKGVETTFKMSIELDGVVYSFSEVNNENIQQEQYILINCNDQIVQLMETCKKLVLEQKYDKLNLDIISLKVDESIASMFKVPINYIQTCWTRSQATGFKDQFLVKLFNNRHCDLTEGVIQLLDSNNSILQTSNYINSSFQHVFEQIQINSIESFFTIVINDKGENYQIAVDNIRYEKNDIITIVVVTIGVSFILACIVLQVRSIVHIVIYAKNLKQRKRKIV